MFYHRVAFLQSKFESWNNVSKVLCYVFTIRSAILKLCQKHSSLGSTEYPNFSQNLQYWRYFDPCKPYPYRPYYVKLSEINNMLPCSIFSEWRKYFEKLQHSNSIFNSKILTAVAQPYVFSRSWSIKRCRNAHGRGHLWTAKSDSFPLCDPPPLSISQCHSMKYSYLFFFA